MFQESGTPAIGPAQATTAGKRTMRGHLPKLIAGAGVVTLLLIGAGAGIYLALSHQRPMPSIAPEPQLSASSPTDISAALRTQLTILRPIIASSSSYAPPARMLAPWESTPADPSPRSVAATLTAPTLTNPPDGAQLTSLSTTLSWTNPPGTTQYHVQVIPWNNDGPGIDLIVGDPALVAKASYIIPAPVFGQGPYIMLPGATYTWKVQVSDVTTSIGPTDPSWSEWSVPRTFTTPKPDPLTIELLFPADDATVSTPIPTLRWTDTNVQIFYYEVQLSSDPFFGNGPQGAVAPVYWNLVHGGITNPLDSWTVPAAAALQPDTYYYWRVRQRVQATPQGREEAGMPWSYLAYFKYNKALISQIFNYTEHPSRQPLH